METCPGMAPTKGRLLVATPPLDDPNFDRSVVYMLEHHDDGAVGVVLNRPSAEDARRRPRRVGRVQISPPRRLQRAGRSSSTR